MVSETIRQESPNDQLQQLAGVKAGIPFRIYLPSVRVRKLREGEAVKSI